MPYSVLYCQKCHERMELQYAYGRPSLWVCHVCGKRRSYMTWSETVVEAILAAILVIGGLFTLVLKHILGYF